MMGVSVLDREQGGRVALLATVAAAILVYANSLANGFAYDDIYVVANRELLHGLSDLRGILTSEYWPVRYEAGLYRPLTLLSFALDWTIWGGRPFGFHLVNVALHAAVTCALTLLLLRFFSWWSALAGGMVFAVHSVHTEAVANVVGRGELLAALFILIGALVYAHRIRAGSFRGRDVLAIFACYILACFSKEVGIVLPGLLLSLELGAWRWGQRPPLRELGRTRAPVYVALFAGLLLVLGARWLALGAPLESVPDRAFALDSGFGTRFFTMTRVWPRYFELLLFPLDLSADYSPAVILPVSGLTPLGAAGILSVLVTVAVAALAWRRAPELSMAIAWAAVTLLPVSNLLIAAQIVLAERTLYLPSVAVSVIAALFVARGKPRTWVALAVLAWVGAFAVVTVQRNPVWKSTETVFEDLRRRHPESSRLLFGVADRMLEAGNWESSREWFRRSFEVWPYHAPSLGQYGFVLLRHDEFEEAEEIALRALKLDPSEPDYHRLLALVRLRAGDADGALQAVGQAFMHVPPDASFYTIQADAYAALGEWGRAVEAQEAAMHGRRGGPDWESWFRLARLRAAAGDTAAALEALQRGRAAPGARGGLADSAERAWRGSP